METGKVFLENNKIGILPITHGDYLSALKKYREDGYEQLILTSLFFINFLKIVFLDEENISVLSINLVDECDDYQQDINEIVEEIKFNRAKVLFLFEELEDLNQNNSIDIYSVHLSKGDNYIAVQNNGFIEGEYTDRFKKHIESMLSTAAEKSL
ncbi:hypothetical protein PUF88_01695 [Lactobacillaceae bacterium L1_55_11]|nr:hypothetical protein [Lactobacillaceae bacterium L1_55_11]